MFVQILVQFMNYTCFFKHLKKTLNIIVYAEKNILTNNIFC